MHLEWYEEVEVLGMNARKVVKEEAVKAFLTATDWYIVRQMEEGIPVPNKIAAKRKLSRELL